MKCLSCQKPLIHGEVKIFNHILLCVPCNEMAEKAQADVRRQLALVEKHVMNWLEDYILKGGLVRSDGREAGGGLSLPIAEVLKVRD